MEKMILSPSKLGNYSDFKSGNYRNKEFIFVLNHMNQIPSIQSDRGQGMHYPPSVRVVLVDTIFDEQKNMMREIRYIPGEMSIYKDEQTSDDKIPKENYSVEFVNGELIKSGSETLLIKFLMMSNKNGSNPDRDKSSRPWFFTVDPGEGLKSVMEKDELSSEAQHFCYKGDWDEVAAYAMVLNLSMDRDPREIRYALRQIAEKDPKKFMAGLKSPKMKRKYFIMEAIKEGVIVKNSATNSIGWKDGATIVQSPIGKDVVDDLVDATFTFDGEKTYNVILGILRPELAPKKLVTELSNTPPEKVIEDLTNTIRGVKPLLTVNDITFDKLKDLIKQAHSKGIVKISGVWHSFDGQKFQGETDFMKKLKGDEILLKVLQERILED